MGYWDSDKRGRDKARNGEFLNRYNKSWSDYMIEEDAYNDEKKKMAKEKEQMASDNTGSFIVLVILILVLYFLFK